MNHALAPGVQIGRYMIVSKIGAGGMGEVYLAHDAELGRPVALKFLSADVASDPQRMRRFVQEARTVSALNHPNILTIYEFGQADVARFIAAEYVDGATLRQHAAGRRLPLPEVLDIGVQVASALAAAHEVGIVHRDVKPENIMIRRDGYVKVVDFGLAKLTQPQVPTGDLKAPTRRMVETEPGVVMGTVAYMSPEQARGLGVDARTDLWSLGVVLFELVTGRLPFTGATPSDVMAAVLTSEPPRLEELAPAAPAELRLSLRRVLAKEPGGRYQTAAELLADLRRLRRRVEAEAEAADTRGRSARTSPEAARAAGASADPADDSQTPESYAAPPDQTLMQSVEIAHVLFTDIVGYSRLPMGEQGMLLRLLQEVVRGTREFQRAQAADQLIRLPTGDGMALVFFGNPVASAQCAVEISRALSAHPELKLRMGVHAGPIYRVSDINTNRNVAGGGINIAQRVMDYGDAGHILVSGTAAEVLGELGGWADKLHDLGEAEVKHGVRVRLFNLYSDEFGDPHVPQKLLATRAAMVTAAAGAAASTGGAAARPTLSAEYLVSGAGRHKRGVILVAGMFALAALVAAAFVTRKLTWPGTPPAPSQAMKFVKVTSTGKADQAAISPDGKYVVHVTSEDGRQSLRMRQVNIASGEQEIVPPAEVGYRGLTFSPDGEFINYVAAEKNVPPAALFRAPILGGPSKRIITNAAGAVTFSPDGKHLAFIRDLVEQGTQVLVAADADGGGERIVALRKFPNFFKSVSWSPDGKTFACGVGSYVPTYTSYVVTIPIEGGAETRVSAQAWFSIGQVAWMPDGAGLIFNASEPGSASPDSSQLWYVSYPGGEVRRITNDLNNYSGVSLTADAGRLVTVQSATVSSLWLMPHSDAARATQITSGISQGDGKEGFAWLPGGRIVFSSKEGGGEDIWVMNADGTGKRQLTSGSGINTNPAASPDGRFVVFTSTRGGASHIWRMDVDGSDVKQLTSGSGENYADVAPDGSWIAYTLFAGKPTLWRVSMDGGTPSPLTDRQASSPAISPDGKTVASIYWEEEPNSRARIALLPSDGGEPLKTFDVAQATWGNVRWSPNGHALAYAVTIGGVSNLWSQPVAGGDPKPLTDFKAFQIFRFGWSREGEQLICARGIESNDVVLISVFR
ncbi:MAG: protein kinase [Acidobacteria bacterium]|nr:protein kinase [Acidobacteriota bacterium]